MTVSSATAWTVRGLPLAVTSRPGRGFLIPFPAKNFAPQGTVNKSHTTTTIGNAGEKVMQREMPFLATAKSPGRAPDELVMACRNRLDAIRLCVQLSRLAHGAIAESLGIDPGHWTRIMQGRAHFPSAKSIDLMVLCGNIAPMQYEAMALGWQLSQDAKAERRAQLMAELAALEAA